MQKVKGILQQETYWLIDYAADILAQHCYNHGQDSLADCCPLEGKHGCPFACRCNRVSGDRWRQYLVEEFNRIIDILSGGVSNDNA